MSLPIISADQRLAEPRGIKGCIFGKSGIGKTSLLWTLNASTTLFMDLEAGDLAIEGWAGDSIRPRTWTECRDFAVFIGGPNPALRDEQSYSPAHYKAVCDRFGDPAALDRYDTIFVDSITVAGRLCFGWCKGQPEALSEKTGITTKQFDSVIRGSRMDCGFYQTFMGYAVEGNRESHKFTLKNGLKDMRYLEAMADSVALANPIGNAVKNSFAMALSAGGDGPQDYVPHLVDFVAARNGVKRG